MKQEKELWKQEKEQQKKDRSSMPKITKKRKVELKFGGVAKKTYSSEKAVSPSPATSFSDLAFRSYLGIN